MTFEDVIETVASSETEDWWSEPCWGATSGPSYRYQPEFWELLDGAKNVFKMESHTNVGSYKPDVSITIAWGLTYLDDFKEPWANKFPDPKASGCYLDIFYNSALIFRVPYVTVDCGRGKLPLPNITGLTVPERYNRIIRLLDSLDHNSDYDSFFQRAGFSIVQEKWPD